MDQTKFMALVALADNSFPDEAAIVAALSGAGGAIVLTLGGVVGVLGPRLYAKFRAMRAPDYD